MSGNINYVAAVSSGPGNPYHTPGFNAGNRDPRGLDEAPSALKWSMCSVDFEIGRAIRAQYNAGNEVSQASMPDPWHPLRNLVSDLLPHLSFERIDLPQDADAMNVLWRVHGTHVLLDIDELSSGEKSILMMFYPLIEPQIQALLSRFRKDKATPGSAEPTVLIDEPELHLHPALQTKVLNHFRALVEEHGGQVIMATHSQAMIDAARPGELFFLRPPESVSAGDNQLVPLASDLAERARLHELLGTSANLTAARPIVVVEGRAPDLMTRRAPDEELYRRLHPQFAGVTLVSGGGRKECLRLVEQVRALLKQKRIELPVAALVDRDLDAEDVPQPSRLLPVSMIENLFLDPDVIWDVIEELNPKERAGIESPMDVAQKLDGILAAMESSEIERRIKAALSTSFRFGVRQIGNIRNEVVEFKRMVDERLDERLSDQAIDESRARAEETVRAIKTIGGERKFYHGKEAVELFRRLLLPKWSVSEFNGRLATRASQREDVRQFFAEFFVGLLSSGSSD